MFTAVRHFLAAWRAESEQTIRVLQALTDASLSQPVAPGHRTLGELAWHVATSVRGIAGQIKLPVDGPVKKEPVPATAAGILAGYERAAESLATLVETQYTDATLRERDQVYGRDWPRGLTLDVLLRHEIHHRGQMTVLMRQAGLKVPGVYGPSADER
ncbi:MAG TPA: DinB family protein [Gemmatimonadales bacterium]